MAAAAAAGRTVPAARAVAEACCWAGEGGGVRDAATNVPSAKKVIAI